MNEFKVKINGNDYNLVVKNVEENIIDMEINGQLYSVELEKPLKTQKTISRPVVTRAVESTVSAPSAPVAKPSAGASFAAGSIKSPLPGVILDVLVKVGDSVSMGQKLIVLEAMKMENTINSDKEGTVKELKVQKGDSVLEGADLVIIG
ncbi:MAG: biotin/lipoyl-binding protein [Prevotellaceae bacterium]|jgi:biotin carboxyl carrier protein|nr:biotin/lipoyl-binding protein [Prevotellaceae bacterium]